MAIFQIAISLYTSVELWQSFGLFPDQYSLVIPKLLLSLSDHYDFEGTTYGFETNGCPV